MRAASLLRSLRAPALRALPTDPQRIFTYTIFIKELLMSEFTSGAIPGMQTPVESTETQVT